jgi:putative toxin-antitoxin system antitoxin component (TIGR02293 family)
VATQLETVDTLLGVAPEEAGSPLALAHSIESGLSVTTVDRLAKAVAPNDATFKYRIVPKATLERRRKSKRPLTSEEGNRLARLAKVYGFALSIYGDEAKVREFLTRPHLMLENKAPLDVALATGPGSDAVVNLLGRAAYSGGA